MNDRFVRVTRYMCGKTIEVYFANKVESVDIKIKTIYKSFAGVKEESCIFTRKRGDVADFYIDCPNLECTESYFDLRDEVNDLFKSKESLVRGEKSCKGKAAPDHLNQKCDATIFYEIRITYFE